MHVLLDTGILLRLVYRKSPAHAEVRQAIRALKAGGHTAYTTLQNLSEFWNVCTRPETARGGLGFDVAETNRPMSTILRIAALLPDSPDTAAHWQRLVLAHAVKGVQVHDARLVALMAVHGVTHLLTLNPGDFLRYPGITPLTPEDVLRGSVASP